MPLYTVHYTLSGEPEVDARMEYDAETTEGVFSRLESMTGVASAVLFEDTRRIGVLRRNSKGIWEVG